MKRKLIFLNLALIAGIAAGAWQVRQRWRAAEAREQAVLAKRLRPAPPPPREKLRPAEPVTAAPYLEIAQKTLFSKDRNPNVVIEKKPEPPPKPMPPLPALYGVMTLPDGPTAIMAEKPSVAHRGIRPGEKIGDFKLVAANPEQISLEWEGKVIEKKVGELMDRTGPPPAAPAAGDSRTPAAAGAAKPAPKGEAAPGIDVGRGIKSCQQGDTSPSGTIANGYRKIVTDTPFGKSCRWEPEQ